MSTDIPQVPTEVELLHTYLGRRLHDEGSDLSLEDALSGFENYYRQLREVRSKVRAAADSLDRGEGSPLDVEGLVSQVRARLAAQGIAN